MKNEVIVERLDTLIKQNKKDHDEIMAHQKVTNGKVIRNTKWRYSFVAAGIVVTGAVLPLIIYIASDLRTDITELKLELKQIVVK